jgi:hypothetical protein
MSRTAAATDSSVMLPAAGASAVSPRALMTPVASHSSSRLRKVHRRWSVWAVRAPVVTSTTRPVSRVVTKALSFQTLIERAAGVVVHEAVLVVGGHHQFGIAAAAAGAIPLEGLADQDRLGRLRGAQRCRRQQQGQGEQRQGEQQVAAIHDPAPRLPSANWSRAHVA